MSLIQQLFASTAQEAKCITLLSSLLYIYVFETLVLFPKLRLSYECTANALKQTAGLQRRKPCLGSAPVRAVSNYSLDWLFDEKR